MAFGLTYPEARTLLYDTVGLPTSHPRLTLSRAVALLWRAQLHFVREACKVGAYPAQLFNRRVENLLAGELQYAPANLWAPVFVRVQDATGAWSKPLKKYTLQRFAEKFPSYRDADGGSPSNYYEMGVNTGATYWGRRQFGMNPNPTDQISNGLEWNYVRAPLQFGEFNSTYQIIDIPGQYHEAMVARAAWIFSSQLSERPREDYDKWGQIFQASVPDYVSECAEQNQMDLEEEVEHQIFGDLSSYRNGL